MLHGFLEQLLDTGVTDTSWDKVLGTIEGGLYGRTYLTTVGGI